MLERLSKQIVNWQIGNRFLAEEERDIYQYAYEVLINQVLNVVIALVLAVLFRAPVIILVFLASYIPLRSFCGGYHAKTNGGCMAASAVIISIVCMAVKAIGILELSSAFLTIPFILSGLLVIRYVPVPDLNKPLDEAETVRYRAHGRFIWLLEAAVGTLFVLFIRGGQIGSTLSVGHLVFSIMLYLGVLKNNRHRVTKC